MRNGFTRWRQLIGRRQALSASAQRQAQFLSNLLLFTLLGSLLLHAAGTVVAAPGAYSGLLLGSGLIVLLILPLYFLSRTVYYYAAAVLAGYVLSALLLVTAIHPTPQPLVLTTLVMPLLLASALLSFRATVVLAVIDLLALALLITVSDDRILLLQATSLYALTAGMLLLITYQQRRVRDEREAELRESELRFRMLSEKALVGVYIVQDGLFRYVNPAMAHLFGYTPQEIVDTLGPMDLTMPAHRSTVLQHVQERLRGEKEEARYILHGLRKNGVQVECDVLGQTMEYNGRPALIGTLIDITGRRQMERAGEDQRALLEALRDTAAALNSTLDLDQILSRILDNVGRVVPHDGANIMLLDGNTVHLVRCQGYYETLGLIEQLMALTYDARTTVNLRYMSETGRPYIASDTRSDPNWRPGKGSEWIRSYIGAPISRGGEVIGFLNLDSLQPGFFDEEHAERLMAFAEQVAIAMKNARLFQDLENYNETLERAVASRTVELRRTTEHVEVILNNSPDAVLLLRKDGTVRMANPAFYEMFGYREQDVLQQPLPSLVTPAEEERFFAALEGVLKRGKRARLELPARRKDGSLFDADLALAPVIDDGVVRGGVCSLHDISRLKEVDRMKDAFVSNVSHELRTPITSLRLYHDLLTRNPAKREIYLQRQEREIDRLNTIIEDLLRLSRLDRGQLDISLQELLLDALIEEYVLDRKPLAADLGLQLEWRPSAETPIVRADRGLLEQVIGIILTNALNYSAAGSCVTICTAVEERDGRSWATCSVHDNGPGIDEQELPLLFDRFFRGAAAQQSRIPGTGLGLAIAREIVERHQGFIEGRNRGDGEPGAIFTVWLPLVEALEAQPR